MAEIIEKRCSVTKALSSGPFGADTRARAHAWALKASALSPAGQVAQLTVIATGECNSEPHLGIVLDS